MRSSGQWRDIGSSIQCRSEPFVHGIVVGWGDCDPARIAYTARIPAWGIEAIEAWYRHCLGVGWYELNLEYGIGTPFVSLGFDFLSPVKPPETLDISVAVSRLGNSSLSHTVEAMQGERICFTGQTTAVFVEAESLTPMRIPPNIRSCIEQYQSSREC